MSLGTIVILGSGETAPGMVKVHRRVLDQLDSIRAVNLDTPYGFQENVPQLTEKIVSYFDVSLQVRMEVLSFRSFANSSELDREGARQKIADATYVFAGPGSPSYAMKQWGPAGVTAPLAEVLARGGVVCFASAAALTLGAFTAPVYEIYKVGDAPFWMDGLDLLSAAGVRCAVIPHYDNAEGQNHDTRFCYLGDTRLRALEAQLPEGVGVLGIDEHTAVVIHLASDTLEVTGKGRAYWRVGGTEIILAQGEVHQLSGLRNSTPKVAAIPTSTTTVATGPAELAEIVLRGGDESLPALARLIDLATRGGDGFILAAPLVEGVLAARAAARAASQYPLADQLRDVLIHAGVEVNDTPTGATWSLTDTATK